MNSALSAPSSAAALQTPLNSLAAQLEVEVGWRGWECGWTTRARLLVDTGGGTANVDHVWQGGLCDKHRLSHLDAGVPCAQARRPEQGAGSPQWGLTDRRLGRCCDPEFSRETRAAFTSCLPASHEPLPPLVVHEHTRTHHTHSHILIHRLSQAHTHMYTHTLLLTHMELQVPHHPHSHPL